MPDRSEMLAALISNAGLPVLGVVIAVAAVWLGIKIYRRWAKRGEER